MFFSRKVKISKVNGEELLTCPRCNIKMEKLKKGDVIIDVCKKCDGMWLDAGEMQKLAQMAQNLNKSGDSEKGPMQNKAKKEGKKDGKKK